MKAKKHVRIDYGIIARYILVEGCTFGRNVFCFFFVLVELLKRVTIG